jgi:hypothetical protein
MQVTLNSDQVYESAVTISDLFSCNYQQHLGMEPLITFLKLRKETFARIFNWENFRCSMPESMIMKTSEQDFNLLRKTIKERVITKIYHFLAEHRMDYLIRPEMLNHNHPLWDHCRRLGWRVKCLRPEFLNNFCSLFPIQVMKILRLGPNVTEFLMQDAK